MYTLTYWCEQTLKLCYRPQRSCGQGYVFTRVCDSVHRGGLQAGRTPLAGGKAPQTRQTPPAGGRNPPTRQADPPAGGRTPLDKADPPGKREEPPWDQADPPWQERETPPWTRQTPPAGGRSHPQTRQTPREADSRIWSTSGRYASYWNAFLFTLNVF